MTSRFGSMALAFCLVLVGACGDEEPTDGPPTGTSSSTAGGMGGAGGGEGGTGSGGAPAARPCITSGDCEGRNGVAVCSVDLCMNGLCQVVFDATGVLCGDGVEVCDGRGQCGEFMPTNASECYVPTPLVPACPLCDDGDPATHDDCKKDETSGARYCVNTPAEDGYPCGPYYVTFGGQCCPDAMVP
jgi:hypothetical protein